MTKTEDLKKYLIPYLNEITTKKGSKYICPLCNSGTGKNATPAFNIVPDTNETKFKCHSCGDGGDVIDLYCKMNSSTVAEAIQVLQSKYGNYTYTPTRQSQQSENEQEMDYSSFFIEANKNLFVCDYLVNRGISIELQNAFKIGYVPSWRHPKKPNAPSSPRIIIPTSNYSYLARDTRINLTDKQNQYSKQKVGKMNIFNLTALYNNNKKYCFVVEGEIDCLSVLQCGYNCIGLGSVNVIERKLLTVCKSEKPSLTLIFALDNDEAGKKWESKISEFQKIGIRCITANITDDCKDANELLVKNSVQLRSNLQRAVEAAMTEIEPSNPAQAIEITAENILEFAVFEAIYKFETELDIDSYLSRLRQKAKEYRLTKEFDSISRSHRKEAVRLLKERQVAAICEDKQHRREIYGTPEWILYNNWDEPYINEPAFIDEFISKQELKCINGQFYSIDGIIPDGEIKNRIQQLISCHIIKNIAKLTENLYKGLINSCYSEALRASKSEIHVKNGILMTNGTFVPQRCFCINRLNIDYDINAPEPKKWLSYLHELIETEDIYTLQEFIGYCFIPTTKAQTMLFLIGNGGEGKSVIGEVLNGIFANGMVQGEISKVASDKYFAADLENKLLMLDDDIDFSAIGDTGRLKAIVTASTPFRIERKYANKYDSYLYTRLLCFGNSCLSSLYDNTDGFYRRQTIIKTKPKDNQRTDNPLLASEIIADELSGVFLWAFKGLQRLISNNFKLTVSEKSQQALKEAQEENFNFTLFLKDMAVYDTNFEITTTDLYFAYELWCNDNGFKALARSTITKYLKNNSLKMDISYSENCLSNNNGRRARGFRGIKMLVKHVSTIN